MGNWSAKNSRKEIKKGQKEIKKGQKMEVQ
jgi:hypothetical protein